MEKSEKIKKIIRRQNKEKFKKQMEKVPEHTVSGIEGHFLSSLILCPSWKKVKKRSKWHVNIFTLTIPIILTWYRASYLKSNIIRSPTIKTELLPWFDK